MTYSNSQLKAVARIAEFFGDPWMIGKEAARIKREQKLTDKDIVLILRNTYDRASAESTIQCARVMYGIFGDARVQGCGYSHHCAATIVARGELQLNGTHDLSKDQARVIRARAFEILEGVKDAYGPKPTVEDVRLFLRSGDKPATAASLPDPAPAETAADQTATLLATAKRNARNKAPGKPSATQAALDSAYGHEPALSPDQALTPSTCSWSGRADRRPRSTWMPWSTSRAPDSWTTRSFPTLIDRDCACSGGAYGTAG